MKFALALMAVAVLAAPARVTAQTGCFDGTYTSTIPQGEFTHTETDTVQGGSANGVHRFDNMNPC